MGTPKTLIEAIKFFSNTDNAFAYLVSKRWPNGVACPRCGCVEPSFLSTRKIWKCKGCKKQFSVKVGTIFEDSALGLDKWLTAVWLIVNSRNGISSYEVARTLGVKQDTAWHMMHRIRKAMEVGSFEKMSGAVEADEMAVGGLERFKHEKKRGNVGGGSAGKEIVLGLYEHGGQVRTQHVKYEEHKTLFARVRENVEDGSALYTDTATAYKHMGQHYAHTSVNHKIGQYVKNGATTNHMENVWSCYKRAIKGSYIHVSGKHLHRYLSEMDYRYNVRDEKDADRFSAVISNVNNKRLEYKTLTSEE